jgi:FtsH-binding integral membrane protein
VDLLFAAFVALQVGYLFGGRDTIDAAGVPYSAYARRGFFELIGCASLVGALLFAIGLQPRALSRATTALGVGLVALTLVVLASAWYRLDLYQLAYGWTELRFYALAAIVFLAIALLILGWCVATGGMRYAPQPIVMAALVVALAVNALSPSAFVARADLERIIDPSALPGDAERTMDTGYLVSLGDGAVPVLVELLPSLPPAERDLLRAGLRPKIGGRPAGQDAWESFNLDRARARDALSSLR